MWQIEIHYEYVHSCSGHKHTYIMRIIRKSSNNTHFFCVTRVLATNALSCSYFCCRLSSSARSATFSLTNS